MLVRKEKKVCKISQPPPPMCAESISLTVTLAATEYRQCCPPPPHCSHPTPFGHRSACGIRLCECVCFRCCFCIYFFVTFITCTCLKGFPRLAPRLQSPTTVQYASKHRQQQPHQKGPLEPVLALVEVFYRHESHHFCMTFRFVPPARSTVRVYRARPPAITSLCRPISNRSGRNSTSETPQFRPPRSTFRPFRNVRARVEDAGSCLSLFHRNRKLALPLHAQTLKRDRQPLLTCFVCVYVCVCVLLSFSFSLSVL